MVADLAQVHERYPASLTNAHYVYGDRVGSDLSTVYLNANELDHFVAAADQRALEWMPEAPLAASSVKVTVQGHPAALGSSGTFDVLAPRPASGSITVIATDGTGRATGLQVPVLSA